MQSFFHVCRNGEFKTTTLTLKTDYAGIPFYNVKDVYTEDDVRSLISAQFPSGLSTHGTQYFLQRIQFGKSQGKSFASHDWVLELVLELIRASEFPKSPSRFTSFFSFGTLDDAKKFRESHGNSKVAIYRVSGNAMFKADMKMLHLGPTAAGAIIFARRYWRGEALPEPLWEYLLSFPVSVHEKVA